MTISLARCHICAALLADEADDRRLHIGAHNHDEKVIDGMRKALKDAAAKILELRQELADARSDIETLTPAEDSDTGGRLVINEIPDEDLDAELDDDDEIDAHDDPDLADLNDITGPVDIVTTQLVEAGVSAADLAPTYPAIDRDDEDDLDLRIARQTGGVA